VVRLLPSSLLARELRRHVVHGEHEPEVKCINADLSELCENRYPSCTGVRVELLALHTEMAGRTRISPLKL